MALEAELEHFETIKDGLIAANAGKFALVHGKELVEVFNSYEDALKAGYGRFGLQPFLVKQIQAIETVQFISRLFDPPSCHI